MFTSRVTSYGLLVGKFGLTSSSPIDCTAELLDSGSYLVSLAPFKLPPLTLSVPDDIHNDDCDRDDDDDDNDDDDDDNDYDENEDDDGVIGDVMNGMLFLVNDVNVITFIYGKRLHLRLLLLYACTCLKLFANFVGDCSSNSSSISRSSSSSSYSPITDGNSSSNANM
uniref:Uncharacterized protein n=1 Tax=Glossina austeni TaxID=7395 RepID=A0A1A9VCE5_GLOAU